MSKELIPNLRDIIECLDNRVNMTTLNPIIESREDAFIPRLGEIPRKTTLIFGRPVHLVRPVVGVPCFRDAQPLGQPGVGVHEGLELGPGEVLQGDAAAEVAGLQGAVEDGVEGAQGHGDGEAALVPAAGGLGFVEGIGPE